MAGGTSFLVGSVTVGGTSKYDITKWGYEFGADVLFNLADGRKFPQQAASVNHSAVISFTSLDLAVATQASSSSPIVGSAAGSGGVVLSVLRNTGTSASAVITCNPAVCMKASGSGAYGDLSTVDQEWKAAGTGGTEPTVTIAIV